MDRYPAEESDCPLLAQFIDSPEDMFGFRTEPQGTGHPGACPDHVTKYSQHEQRNHWQCSV